MTDLVTLVRNGEEAIVRAEWVDEWTARGWSLPDGKPAGIGTDSADQFSDEQLRAAIEAATGEKVHHKTGREKLAARFNEINEAEAARQDEKAANGLTRREIEADLVAMGVEFDPADKLDDLAALRDLAREERAKG